MCYLLKQMCFILNKIGKHMLHIIISYKFENFISEYYPLKLNRNVSCFSRLPQDHHDNPMAGQSRTSSQTGYFLIRLSTSLSMMFVGVARGTVHFNIRKIPEAAPQRQSENTLVRVDLQEIISFLSGCPWRRAYLRKQENIY